MPLIDQSSNASAEFVARAKGALRMQKMICDRPDWASRRVFDDLLSQVRDTAFGREHNLRFARTVEDWRDAIPIRSHTEFEGYIERIARGERNVLTKSDPYGFLKTSGTSGSPKLIPTTPHWRHEYRGPALYAQWGLYFHLLGLSAVEPHTAFDLSWERASERSTLTYGQLPVYSITQRHESLGGADWTPPWYGATWFRTTADSPDDALYRKARHLAGKAVRLLVSVNPSKIIRLGEIIDRRSDELIRDVYEGTFAGRSHPSFDPDPEFARGLENLRSLHGRLRLDHLYPELSMLVCWTAGSAKLYEPWLSSLVPNIPTIPFSTTGTEGIVTVPIDGSLSGSALAINQGMYEFAEVDDPTETKIGPVRDFPDVEVGKTYRLIMSQANGLYRYDTGDLYKMTGWAGRSPRVQFVSRVGNVSSFTGEKLTEVDVGIAMDRVFDTFGIRPAMYTAVPVWGTPPGYVFVVEWTPDLSAHDRTRLSPIVEDALARINIEYREKRVTQRLAAARVVFAVDGAFNRVLAAKVSNGASAAQVKHVWLQRDDSVLRDLRTAHELLEEMPVRSVSYETEIRSSVRT